MTNITLHGIIAKEFGSSFQINVTKAKNVLKAIDANKDGFLKRINDLGIEGLHYAIIVDGEKITDMDEFMMKKVNSEIHIVPMIIGAGFVQALVAIGGAIVSAAQAVGTFIGTVLTSIGGAISAGFSWLGGLFHIGGAAGAAGGAGAGGAVGGGGFLGGLGGQLAIGLISMGLQLLLAPKAGGGSTTSGAGTPAAASQSSQALQQSYMFSGKPNLATQGSPVPVGYGRLKIGSQVLQYTIKSFQQRRSASSAMNANSSTASSTIATTRFT